MEQTNQQKGAEQHHLEHRFGADDLVLDTGGQVRPAYELVPRRAGALAVGELAMEPILGPVRVMEAGVRRQ